MKFVFPYIKKAANFYPAIDIRLLGKQDSIIIKALIDSGASFSVFRPEIAEQIGVKIERGKRIYLEGIGGRILGYIHKVPVRVGNKKFACRIVFSREFTVSFNLLGRDNFFTKFLITFDENKKEVVLE